NYGDPVIQLARLERAPEAALGTVSPWIGQRLLTLAGLQGSLIGLSGPVAPGLLDGVDPARVGRDTIALRESMEVIARRALNWTIVPGPNAAWAKLVHPDQDEAGALAALWAQIAHICRLDETDPAAAWHERSEDLSDAARRLDAARLDA